MPVPSSVIVVTEAYRRFIRWKDEETIAGTVKFGTKRKNSEPEKGTSLGRSRGRAHEDFRRPAPPAGRPANGDGATSFHVEHTSVSKTRETPGTAPASGGSVTNPAAHFDRYLAELTADKPDPAMAFDRYASDLAHSETDSSEPSRVAYLRSSISHDALVRDAFWNAAWAAARTPGLPRIELRPRNASVGAWIDIAMDPSTPPSVAKIASDIAGRRERAHHENEAEDPFEVISVTLTSETDIAWAEGVGNLFGATKAMRSIHYPAPRGGLVQMRLVMELPHELEEAAIRRIADALAADFNAIGVRYTLVVHAPDRTNDDRNWHIHVAYFPGPSRQRPDDSWDFRTTLRGGRMLRPGDMHNRLGGVDDQLSPKLTHWAKARADITTLRKRFADACNVELAAAGVARRLDPRSFAEMGIDQEPQSHLGTAASELVDAGVAVDVDLDNARKGWAGMERRLLAKHKARTASRAAVTDKLEKAILLADERQHASLIALRQAYVSKAEEVAEGNLALDLMDLRGRIARSGADRALVTTERLLRSLKTDAETASVARRGKDIERRRHAAQHHIAEIDQAVEMPLAEADVYREEIAALERELADLTMQIERAVTFAKSPIDAAPPVDRWANETALPIDRYPHRLPPHEHMRALDEYLRSMDAERIFIVKRQGRFKALGLGVADAALLSRHDMTGRAQRLLGSFHENQKHAVDRLLAYVRVHGHVYLEAGFGPNLRPVPTDIVNLYAKFGKHPDFRDGVYAADQEFEAARFAEYEERVAEDIDRIVQPPPTVSTEHPNAVSPTAAAHDAEHIDEAPDRPTRSESIQPNIAARAGGADGIVIPAPEPLSLDEQMAMLSSARAALPATQSGSTGGTQERSGAGMANVPNALIAGQADQAAKPEAGVAKDAEPEPKLTAVLAPSLEDPVATEIVGKGIGASDETVHIQMSPPDPENTPVAVVMAQDPDQPASALATDSTNVAVTPPSAIVYETALLDRGDDRSTSRSQAAVPLADKPDAAKSDGAPEPVRPKAVDIAREAARAQAEENARIAKKKEATKRRRQSVRPPQDDVEPARAAEDADQLPAGNRAAASQISAEDRHSEISSKPVALTGKVTAETAQPISIERRIAAILEQLRNAPSVRALSTAERQRFLERAEMAASDVEKHNLMVIEDHGVLQTWSSSQWVHVGVKRLANDPEGWRFLRTLSRELAAYMEIDGKSGWMAWSRPGDINMSGLHQIKTPSKEWE